jgi:hypothetical protein
MDATSTLACLYSLVGDHAVLLPLEFGEKKPPNNAWQTTTYERTQESDYRSELDAAIERQGNIGVLMVGGLATVDIDNDLDAEEFLALNPKLATTLRTRGARGCNHWLRITGDYPRQVYFLKKTDGTSWGEWRGGGQTVIAGQHPSGVRYHRLVEHPAIEVAFDDINWPASLVLTWKEEEQRIEHKPDTLEKRISAYIAAIPGAVAGNGGHPQTFKVACYLVNGWALSAAEAMPYLQAYNQRCLPMWSDKELAHKLDDAEKAQHKEPREHLREDRDVAPLDFSRYKEVNSTFPKSMGEAAFHGICGHVVDAIAEQSEACREAILIQFLCAIGNVIGRSAYAYGGDSMHHARLWTIVVGATSKGRKGTAWNGVKRLLETLDKKWVLTRLTSGASSGEGVIHNVRDAKYGIPKSSAKKKKTAEYVYPEEVLLDAGESDKRLPLIEEEFAQVFRVIERVGNTLSPVLRQAWDGSQLSIPNKNSGERATNPHVTVIGHITKEELSKFSGSAELLNGFANRFLWCASKRTEDKPFSECVEWTKYPEIIKTLKSVIEQFNPTSTAHRLKRNKDANILWEKHYKSLSAGYCGALGGILNRAEAQVFRLSIVCGSRSQHRNNSQAHGCSACSMGILSGKRQMDIR